MPGRVLLRVVMSVLLIGFVVLRALRSWRYESRWWLAGSLAISLILALIVISELLGLRKRWRTSRDEVPNKPLGLE